MDIDFEECNDWLAENHPDLIVKRWVNGSWSLEQKVDRWCRSEEDNGDTLMWKEQGLACVCNYKNTLLHLDFLKVEVAKRDPKKSHWQGNFYHDGYLESKRVEDERDEKIKRDQESAKVQWDIVSRSPIKKRMDEKLARGDVAGAYNELRIETIEKRAIEENRHEAIDMMRRGGIEE